MANYTVTTTDDTGVNTTVTGDLAAETADGGGLSLREAVLLANASYGSDTIEFDASLSGATITLSGTEIAITDRIVIDGDIDNDKAPDITIDADGDSRVFNATSVTAVTTLTGLTITGGYTAANNAVGGGVRSVAKLYVNDSVITGNSTQNLGSHGGGIYATNALTLNNTVVSYNSTAGQTARGGGAFSFSEMMLVNSTITGNSTTGDSSEGGGIGSLDNITLTNSTVSGNSTTGSSSDGGGIAAIGSGYVTLTNSTVSGNTTTGTAAEGGGIFVRGDFNATNSTIANNGTTNLTSEGGGVWAYNGAYLENSTVTGNYTLGATSKAGGIWAGDRLQVTNSLVLGNVTPGYGTSRSQLYSFDFDIRTYGVNILSRDDNSIADVFTGAIDVGDTAVTDVFAQTVTQNGVTTGVLADNGGPVQTVALKISATNRALDASSGTPPATDARGVSSVDLPGIRDASGFYTARDLGAYETLNPLIVTTLADTVDVLVRVPE